MTKQEAMAHIDAATTWEEIKAAWDVLFPPVDKLRHLPFESLTPQQQEAIRAEVARQKAAVALIKDKEGRLLSPNGKVSKLNEEQYRTVRTPWFKEWAGDWETLSAQNDFDAMSPYELNVPDSMKSLTTDDLRIAVEQHLIKLARQGISVQHQVLGAIDFGVNASGKMINKSHDPAKLYVASDIEKVLMGARFVSTSPSTKKNKSNEQGYHTLISKIDVFGRELAVILTVKQDNNGQIHYNHIVVTDKKISSVASPGDILLREKKPAPALTELDSIVRPELKRVNPDSVTKVVDPETGEPMVVYHGTSADFNTFDRDKINSNRASILHKMNGFLFTAKKHIANQYGNNIKVVFLNIKNPAESLTHYNSDIDCDGIIKDVAILVRNPNQIKSADGNLGTFSPEKGSIAESAGNTYDWRAALDAATTIEDINAMWARLFQPKWDIDNNIQKLESQGIKTATNIDGKVIELRGNGRVARLRKSGAWQVYQDENLYDTARDMDEAVEMLLESAVFESIPQDKIASESVYDWQGQLEKATTMQDIAELFETLFPGVTEKKKEFQELSQGVMETLATMQNLHSTPEEQWQAVSEFGNVYNGTMRQILQVSGLDVSETKFAVDELRRSLPAKMLDAYISRGQIPGMLDAVADKKTAYDTAYTEIMRMQEEILEKYVPDDNALQLEVDALREEKQAWSKRKIDERDHLEVHKPEELDIDKWNDEYWAGVVEWQRKESALKNSNTFLQKKDEEIAALPWDDVERLREEAETAKIQAHEQIINTLLEKSPVSEKQAEEWLKNNVILDKTAMAKSAKGGFSKSAVEKQVKLFYRITGGRLPRLEFTTTRKNRSAAAHWSGELFVGSSFDRSTLWHEMAHLLEDDYKLKASAVAFRDKRRENNILYKLKDLVPGANYKDDELAYKDTWFDPYVGKEYGVHATEVISMGMQQLASPEMFFELQEKDPEHLAFMLGLCTSTSAIDADATGLKQARTQEKLARINNQEVFLKELDKLIAKAGDFWSADGYEIATSKWGGKAQIEIRYNRKYDDQGHLNSYSNYTLKSEKSAKRALYLWYKAGKPTSGFGELNDMNLGNIVLQLDNKRQKTLPEYIINTPLGAL